MLEIEIEQSEFWDDISNTFVYVNPCVLTLEHSLISLSKWESKWNKPFLTDKEKSLEEIRDYIRCMTVNKVSDPNVYLALTQSDIIKINDYISLPMTATTFTNHKPGRSRHQKEIMTAEIIYFYMISYGIPFECEKWHLNRLLTLIKVCNIKNSPKQKMSRAEAAKQQRALNAQRRARSGSRG